MDLIIFYQNAMKTFCEDPNLSVRNNESIFRKNPSITFFNENIGQVVIFDRKIKIFIIGYKLANCYVRKYKQMQSIKTIDN